MQICRVPVLFSLFVSLCGLSACKKTESETSQAPKPSESASVTVQIKGKSGNAVQASSRGVSIRNMCPDSVSLEHDSGYGEILRIEIPFHGYQMQPLEEGKLVVLLGKDGEEIDEVRIEETTRTLAVSEDCQSLSVHE